MENPEITQPEQQETKPELTLEQQFAELQKKYKELETEKLAREREAKHEEVYKKYKATDAGKKLISRYVKDRDDIDSEIAELSKEYSFLFSQGESTNIKNSLPQQDFKTPEGGTKLPKKDGVDPEIDPAKFGML